MAFRQQAISLVWGQCSNSVKGKIEGLPECVQATKDTDLVKVCQMIQDVMCQFQSNKKQSPSILEAKLWLCDCIQEPGLSCAENIARHSSDAQMQQSTMVAALGTRRD